MQAFCVNAIGYVLYVFVVYLPVGIIMSYFHIFFLILTLGSKCIDPAVCCCVFFMQAVDTVVGEVF